MSLSLIFWVLTGLVGCCMAFMKTPYSLGSVFLLTMVSLGGHMGGKGMLWYPLAMFLVYIGALMVLFLYMACLSPNMRIEFSRRSVEVVLLLVLVGVGVGWYYGLYWVVVQSAADSGQVLEGVSEVQCPSGLLSHSGGDLVVGCGVCLFLSLLSVVKICKYGKGPLRPFKRSALKAKARGIVR